MTLNQAAKDRVGRMKRKVSRNRITLREVFVQLKYFILSKSKPNLFRGMHYSAVSKSRGNKQAFDH